MPLLHNDRSAKRVHPLDLCEDFAHLRDWHYERLNDDELQLHLVGEICDYDLLLDWHSERGLHMACRFGIKVPPAKRDAALRLIACVNARLWLGHFELWDEEGAVLFRAAMPLADVIPTPRLCGFFMEAFEESRHYAMAFHHVLWGGAAPERAVSMTLMETQGSA